MKRKFLMKIVMTLLVIFIITVSPVLAMTYSYDDLGRLTSVTYDSGQSTTYSYDSTGNMLSTTNSAITETLTVNNTTGSGIMVSLSPALDGLQTGDFILLDDQSQPVNITTATTTSSGISYTISAELTAGNTYTITAVKTGYDFGTAQNVVVPAATINETLTVINTTSSGITLALSPALDGLTSSDFTLVDSLNTPVTITGAATSDNGATYAISTLLSEGQTYTITATMSGYTFGVPQNVLVQGQTATPSITGTPNVGNTSVSGTAVMVASVVLSLNGTAQPAVTADANGNWTARGLTLAAGDTISVTAIVKGDTISQAVTATVGGPNTPVTSVSLNKTSDTIAIGRRDKLTASITSPNVTNKKVTWSSSNTVVATVSNTGLVKAVSAGTAIITVTTVDGGITATCTVTVTTSVKGVTLNKKSDTIATGGSDQLTASITPVNATNTNVTWASNNIAVATVSSTGLVKAIAAGTAKITVTTVDGGKRATCTVKVTTPVTSVSLNKTSDTIVKGRSDKLTASITPTNATNKKVTWSSSNTAVATVSNTGLVKAIGSGTAIITVTTVDGGITATCTVTV